MKPGMKGTCWCCGAPNGQDVFELCLDCETVRAEVWIYLAEKNQEQRAEKVGAA